MTLSEAVDYYHSLEKFGIMPGLERIEILANALGAPHKKLKFVHVAGTNGKGSTCTALASVLTEAGYKTGLYTSPYVIDFRERIQYNMSMISPEDLIDVTEKVKEKIEQLSEKGIKITEFEAVTAAALTYYAKRNCDIVVLETGLGGRFDATNIIPSPVCSIITSVSLDHTGILGDTLSAIAFEKSGIIKNGCPVVTDASARAEVLGVIEKQCNEKNAELFKADYTDIFSVAGESINGTSVLSEKGKFTVPWCGVHQLQNMSLVWTAVEILKSAGFDISDRAFCAGISKARIPARTEVLSEKPLVILDGSHNDGSTEAFAKILKKHLSGKRILAVMGMMADKDCRKSLSNLMPCFTEVITVKPSNPRSMSASELALIAKDFGVTSFAAGAPLDGIALAFQKIDKFDALAVCGSLYLAGDVRDEMLKLCKKEVIKGES